MRSLKRAPVAGVAAVLAALGLTLAACGEDQFTIPSPPDAGADARAGMGADGGAGSEGGALLANGTACASGVQCTSGFCADGVCCDTACRGTCESCNAGGSAGTCTAVPDGTDPDGECGVDPTFDGGAPSFDGGYGTSLPATSPNQCAGHCDGKRACAFAPAGTTCGATFCGDPSEQGSAQCDGSGHCLVGVQECGAYACPDGSPGCKAACRSNADCLKPYFCDVASATCTPRLLDGTPCASAQQCAAGTCTTFYRDLDGDGHGTKKVSQPGATTQVCGTTAPQGYAASSDDCFDATVPLAKDVHPGQTAYFATGYTTANSGGGAPSFDYDCSGTEDKETADGAVCGFCDHILAPQAPPPIIIDRCLFEPTCTAADEAAGHACTGPLGCTADDSAAFSATVKCGATAATFTCASCAAPGGAATAVPGADKTQRCH